MEQLDSMDLNDIVVFAKVVESGSFTSAARELDMPKSTVSRRVSELEERLGARLLQRTTRKLSLTDVGETYFQYAARVVGELADAERAVSHMQETPRGLVRLTIPINFGFLAPTLTGFLKRYPEVRLEVVGTDRMVDLIEEGFDLALRAGELSDSSLVARRLGSIESYLVCSPDFARQNGTPKKPEDLERFDCIVFSSGSGRARFALTQKGNTLWVPVKARFTINDHDFVVDAALSGLGIALLPADRCADALRTKKLERVLPEWCSRNFPLYAIYPSARHLSPKVKALLDHLGEYTRVPA